MGKEIVIFGGSFNPPHKGHRSAVKAAAKLLQPDRLLIIPDAIPPHKDLAPGSPSPRQRLALCRLCFGDIPNVEISDLELKRGGKSYTVDTLETLRAQTPEAHFTLLVGTDMLLTLERWHRAEDLFRLASIRAFPRENGDLKEMERKAAALREQYGADVAVLDLPPLPAASTGIRSALAEGEGVELLTGRVYGAIVRQRLYRVRVNLPWLRKKAYAMLRPRRIPHVAGCEEEAVRLAKRWGADEFDAAVAAILHDCTKKENLEQQRSLCKRYRVHVDEQEWNSEKLLHAKTGAALAEHRFGASPAVASAIRWHTTGRAGMSLLEKIIYMADYMEPTRDFPGVERLRELAYQDLDEAMILGLEMSLEEVRRWGGVSHPNSVEALEELKAQRMAH